MNSLELLKVMENFQIFSEQLKSLHPKYAHTLSITQLKILTMLKEANTENHFNNVYFSKKFNISSAAISKAIRDLIKKNLITELRNIDNAREKFYLLTEEGVVIAEQHLAFFQNVSEKILSWLNATYSTSERELIADFLCQWEVKSLSVIQPES